MTADEGGARDEIRRVDRIGPKRRCEIVMAPDFFESYTK